MVPSEVTAEQAWITAFAISLPIVIASSSEYLFTRKEDGSTPWKELQVEKVRER
jgi:hypothetical protein